MVVDEKKYRLFKTKLDNYCQENQMRKSSERDKLLQVICSDEIENLSEHFDADEFFAFLKSRDMKISRATVFRNLTVFVDSKILRKVGLGESHAHYEACEEMAQKHDHLICKKCGKVVEFNSRDIKDKNQAIADVNNFELVDYKYEIYGVCRKCQSKVK